MGRPDAKRIVSARMEAVGAWKGGRLRFDATNIRRSDRRRDIPYSLDHFTGSIGASGTLDAINNDGANAFDRPYSFTRIRCGA